MPLPWSGGGAFLVVGLALLVAVLLVPVVVPVLVGALRLVVLLGRLLRRSSGRGRWSWCGSQEGGEEREREGGKAWGPWPPPCCRWRRW